MYGDLQMHFLPPSRGPSSISENAAFEDLESGENEKKRQEIRAMQLAAEELHKEKTDIFNKNERMDDLRRKIVEARMKMNPTSNDERETGRSQMVRKQWAHPYRDPDTPIQDARFVFEPSKVSALKDVNDISESGIDAAAIQGIGAFEEGEENDYDQFVPFDGGKKKGTRKSKTRKSKTKKSKTKKSKTRKSNSKTTNRKKGNTRKMRRINRK